MKSSRPQKIGAEVLAVTYSSRTNFIGPGMRVAWHHITVSIHLQSIFDSFHSIPCKKFLQKVQVAYAFHGDDSDVPPQDQKMPFQLRPCNSPRDFGLDFECASIFSYTIYLSMNSRAFHMLGARKCCQKRHIFYCRVQFRMFHHKLHVGSHEL